MVNTRSSNLCSAVCAFDADLISINATVAHTLPMLQFVEFVVGEHRRNVPHRVASLLLLTLLLLLLLLLFELLLQGGQQKTKNNETN